MPFVLHCALRPENSVQQMTKPAEIIHAGFEEWGATSESGTGQ